MLVLQTHPIWWLVNVVVMVKFDGGGSGVWLRWWWHGDDVDVDCGDCGGRDGGCDGVVVGWCSGRNLAGVVVTTPKIEEEENGA
nr:hypothetical protein [Tanacetum cinerariifolium]